MSETLHNIASNTPARVRRMTGCFARPTAIVAHPYWGRGGAESAAMWVIESLRHDFDVTVYTRGGFDLQELNALADTAIKSSELDVRVAHRANTWPLGALAHGAYLGSLQSVGAEYDLRVTASGVAHWGLPAIQFISSAIWNDSLATKFNAPNAPHRRTAAQATLWRLAAELSGQRNRSLREDLFVANSKWTALQSAQHCPRSIQIIHPAVPLPPNGPDWGGRENGVLVLGRVSPEKNIELCIQIIERLRDIGWPLRLCIAGPNGEAEYSAHIDSLCRERSEWIERHSLVVGHEKCRLLGRFRYGLSACAIEAFGIATAEMSAAGIITLAPKCGGQQEILTTPNQLYETVEEAIVKFGELLDDRNLQNRLHEKAIAERQRFAPEQFTNEVRELAIRFVASSRSIDDAHPDVAL